MSKVIEQIVRLTIDGDEMKAEVVGEIVRCRDCRHTHGEQDYEYFRCHYSGYNVVGNFYCAHGERKETEDETSD